MGPITVTTRRLQAIMKRVVENIWRTKKLSVLLSLLCGILGSVVVFDLGPDIVYLSGTQKNWHKSNKYRWIFGSGWCHFMTFVVLYSPPKKRHDSHHANCRKIDDTFLHAIWGLIPAPKKRSTLNLFRWELSFSSVFLEENHNRNLEGLTFHEGTRPTPGSEAGKMG